MPGGPTLFEPNHGRLTLIMNIFAVPVDFAKEERLYGRVEALQMQYSSAGIESQMVEALVTACNNSLTEDVQALLPEVWRSW